MDLDFLEDLSNKELRKICVQHNLPNIPITDSSRKVMLRKLRVSMSGEPETTNKTKRRETVHNTNISTNKTAATTAARTGAKSPTRVAVTNTNKARRTVANSSPSSVRSKISHTTTTLSSSDIGSQSEEDDSYNTYSARREERPELRRSVSLTKSGVLTTSYTQETKPLGAAYEEMDEYDAEESPLTNSTFEQPQYKVFQSPQRPDPFTLPSYEPVFERKIQQNLFSRPPPQLSQTQLRSSSYSGIAGSNTNIDAAPINSYAGSRAPFNYDATTEHTLNRAQRKTTFDDFKVPFNVPAAHSRNISTKRRTTTGLINTGGSSVAAAAGGGGPSLYPKLNQFYDQRTTVNTIESSSSEEEYEDEIMEPEPYETPFLSKFTRTIETAKRNTIAGTSPKPQARRGLLREDGDDVGESFSQLLMALERKYHLKQAFAILITVILAIFIYVMVW